jgi:uncharacterized membrane protein
VAASSPSAAARCRRLGVAAVIALTLVEVLWELWLAPLRPGGSWLALKALPLALLWPSLARGARRTRQWLTLLLPAYVAEGVVRAASEPGRHALVAATAALVATVAFAALLATFRSEFRRRQPPQ